jgi:hypothetical protein
MDARLQATLDRHRGCPTVFVAATGPSLETLDTRGIDTRRHVVIACNTAYRLFGQATIAHHADVSWWRTHGEDLHQRYSGELVTGAGMGTNRPRYPDTLVHLDCDGHFVLGGKAGAVSGMNVGQQALVLAHWFQPRTIVLLGVDHNRAPSGQSHWRHAAPIVADARMDALWQAAMKWFVRFEQQRAAEWAQLGFTTPLPEVLNASPTSAVTQFRKIDSLAPYL